MIEPSFECCEIRKNKKCCIDIIIYILSVIFALVLGVLLGAVTGVFGALGLGAFVAILVILALLIIVRALTLLCCKKC